MSTEIDTNSFLTYQDLQKENCLRWRVIYTCEGQTSSEDCNMDEACKTMNPSFQCLEKPWSMNHWQAFLGVLFMILLTFLFFWILQRKPVIVRKLFSCLRSCCGCFCKKPKDVKVSEPATDENAEPEEKEELRANES